MKTPLVLRYFIWSMLIFAVSMVFLSFRMLRPLELRSLDLGALLRYGRYRQSMKEVNLPFLTLPIYNPQLSHEEYLRIAQDAVHHLKMAGAKVVIVPLPEYLESSKRITSLIQKMSSDSIVVFGVESPSNSPLNPWPEGRRPDDRRNWWVSHPLYNRSKVPWGVISVQTQFLSPLTRFVPIGFRESNTGEPVSDVAVVALKRYFGVTGEVEAQPSSSRLQVGPYSIQLERDGLSYLKNGFSTNRWMELYAAVDFVTDSLFYYPTMWEGHSPGEKELEKAWKAHEGKIVIIDWAGFRPYRFLGDGWTYLQVFGAVFNRSFVRVHNEWNVLLITTLVVLLSVFSYTFRNGLTVFVSLVLAVATIAVCIWLFDKHNVLVEPLYILVPILLCGFLLPIVKTAGEKHLAEEKIKSLEAENRQGGQIQQR